MVASSLAHNIHRLIDYGSIGYQGVDFVDYMSVLVKKYQWRVNTMQLVRSLAN